MRRQDFLQRMSSCIMLTLLLASGLLASCSTEDMMHTEGTPLPEGKYPLELAAGGLQAVAEQGRASAPLTRGTADNNWNGISSVAVQVDGEVKEYAVTAGDDGITARLSSDNPFYWNTSNETKDIVAWYPYSATEPTQWTVKADQSSKENYEASDLIKGKLSLTFADRNNSGQNKLTFRHQTAQVKITLKAVEGVTLDGETSVFLNNVQATGIDTNGNAIIPYKPEEGIYSYLALVNGQTIKAGTQFLNVQAEGGNFYYTPADEILLEAGNTYTFNVTVKSSGIEVEAETSGEWENGGDEIINSVINIYTAENVKLGDYVYSDGSISDGGLRKLYFDGSLGYIKASPLTQKTCVGVIFHIRNEKSYKDVCNYEKFNGNPTGYIVSLDEGRSQWCQKVLDKGDTTDITVINGYECTKKYGNYTDKGLIAIPWCTCHGQIPENEDSRTTFSTWYLPSFCEYKMMRYAQGDKTSLIIDFIENNIKATGASGFTDNFHFTSGLMGSWGNYLYVYNPKTGADSPGMFNNVFYNTYPYRAVCAFKFKLK